MITPSELAQLPEAEMRSLAGQAELARVFASAMQLNGARTMSGDVLSALARLGLRLTSVDDGDASFNAQARLDTITESQPCSCGDMWLRLTNSDDGPGIGWWHRSSEDYTTRKCEDGGRRLKP